MKDKSKKGYIYILSILGYIFMLSFNILANALPLNGVRTGEVSDEYTNLFTPPGYVFSIWSVIYLLLFLHIIYILMVLKSKKEKEYFLLDKIGIWFIVSSLLNGIWIIAWHYKQILISMIIIFLLMVSLIKINDYVSVIKGNYMEYFLVKLPFFIYLAWITIALTANITIFLVSIGFKGGIIRQCVWTIIVLSIAAVICILLMKKNKTASYGIVYIWTYTGIMIRHIHDNGFKGMYIGVIAACFISMVIIMAFIINIKVRRND